jgi:hypothetical protein
MMPKGKGFLWVLLLIYGGALKAQNQSTGRLSGSFQSNVNFFLRDEAIGAANTPQYDRQLLGNESWLNLDYSNWGFDMGLRFDLFNNTNIFDPLGSFNGQGIGRWYIRKQIGKLQVMGGHIYDQIGSGVIFRAYEARALAIDNALFGVKAAWEFDDHWQIKAFTGKQRNIFSFYNPVFSGANLEGFIPGNADYTWSLVPGIGMVMRSFDDGTMNQIVSAIETYTPQDGFTPRYNTRAVTLYNTLSTPHFTWYVEGAYKTEDTFFDPFAERTLWTGGASTGKLVSRPGNILYTSVGYNTGGLGLILEGKRTENFIFRVDPFASQLLGMVNFLPPMARVNTYRLTARYNAATQEIGETAAQASVRYSVNDELSLGVDYSQIMDLDMKDLFYREVYFETNWKPSSQWNILAGVQHQWYNQFIYEGATTRGEPARIGTIVPYTDIQYAIDDTRAVRWELSAMFTGVFNNTPTRDYGNWIFGLVEYTIAPHWTFTLSDMWNFERYNLNTLKRERAVHYPRVDVFYATGPSRFAFSYIKQVDGIVCTGGICRYEPAFSGFRVNMQTNF